MGSKTPKPAEQTFETAIERLDRIVDEMEGEKLPLDQLLELYEEGTKLVKVCQEKLESAEKRIDLITRTSAGKVQLTEFEPAPAPVQSAPSPTPPSSSRKPQDSEEVSLF